jgi:hypothetical protein
MMGNESSEPGSIRVFVGARGVSERSRGGETIRVLI